MWRPWCNTSNTSEENIQVVPETDENHVEETSDKSTNPQHPDPSIVIPETEESASTSTQNLHQQQNILQCPKFMQYLYLQSQHNEQAGKIIIYFIINLKNLPNIYIYKPFFCSVLAHSNKIKIYLNALSAFHMKCTENNYRYFINALAHLQIYRKPYKHSLRNVLSAYTIK